MNDEEIRRRVESMYAAMVAAGLVSEDPVADKILRAAGYPVLPPIFIRMNEIERALRACEARLLAVEEKQANPVPLSGRLFARLTRPRTALPSRKEELPRDGARQGKVA
jgi:hypothetical protein